MIWDGVTKPESFSESHLKIRHQLADDAKHYRWSAVLAVLDEHPYLVNAVRPGGASGYAALHQAAHGNAPADVVRRLVERGAWRTIRNGAGERPYDIAARLGHAGLLSELEPVYRRDVPAGVLLRLQSYLHTLIRSRAGALVDEHALRLPELEVLLELDEPSFWFAVPGMYGGFSVRLEGDGLSATLISESWCRVVGGSGQRHEVSCARINLLDEGFV